MERWDFMVRRPHPSKRVRQFAKHIEIVTALAAEMIVKEDIPVFLCSYHKLLKESPIKLMWKEGEKGFRKVMEQFEGMETGSFA